MTRPHIDVFGDGEAAVLIHGSFGWGLDTFPHQQALADRYRVHLVDRAGYGASPATEPIGWPTDMHDLAEILDEVGPAHLVGQSYGGVVALLAAGLRPDKVRSLVVVEPPMFGIATNDDDAAALAAQLRQLADRAQSLDTAGYVAAFAGIVMGLDGSAVDNWIAGFTAPDWAAAESSRREHSPVDAPIDFATLAGLTVPKVVAAGGWPDHSAPNAAAGRAFRAVVDTIAPRIGAEMVVFDRSTHNPQLQQPDEFNRMLRRVWS